MGFFGYLNKIITKYGVSILLGIRTTLYISLVGTLVGLLIGMIVGGFRAVKLDYTAPFPLKTGKKIIDKILTVYIDIFRGTPMMVQAMFLYYAFLDLIGWSQLTAAVVVISINTGAYMAEIIRSGIQAIDAGQTEAARSLGMSNAQTMWYVILPQAIRNAFPAIGNELIVNIKDSSVLMILSINELMFQTKSIAGSTYRFIETYFLAAMIYFILTKIAAMIMNHIELRINHQLTSIPQSDTSVNIYTTKTKEED